MADRAATVTELPLSAQTAYLDRVESTKTWCPTRGRWLKIETEANCPEHKADADALLDGTLEGVQRGRWDGDRHRYVAWE